MSTDESGHSSTNPVLKRDVAIKVLPDEFAQDAERVARFQREAEVLASLNHPHIAAIYDLAEFDCSRFLVLELVEGETLADRIARGPILLDEALPMARQVAEALEAAHEKRIIHRDLKPANIKLTNDWNVKVLDFGLAKVQEAESAAANLSNAPTMMTAGTPGTILGTPAYMSPEQAKGKEADRTTDVWAFGCVLYEMLTGRAAFEGETVGELLGGVFKAEPDWCRLPAGTPEGIRRLLRRCLQKERRLRFHDMADARIELEEVQTEPQTDARAVLSAPRRKQQLAWSAFVLVTLVAVAAIVQALRPAPPTFEARLEIVTPPTGSPASLAISPDGRKVVFETSIEGRSSLSLRSLDSTSLRQLTGTDGASNPFWSPDSASVGFFAEGRLKRIDIDSGSVRMLASAPTGRGGTWSRSGVILFTPDVAGPVFRISASGGGEPVAVTRVDAPRQGNHRFPQFLPDGRQVAMNRTVDGNMDVWLLELRRSLLSRFTLDPANDTGAIWSPDSKSIVFSSNRKGAYDLYQKSAASDGSEERPLLVTPESKTADDWSRDGRFLLYRGGGLWALRLDGDRKIFPIVPGNFDAWGGQFSSDGKWVAYHSNEGERFEIFVQPFPGPGSKTQISVNGGTYVRWSRDGRELFYIAPNGQLMAVPIHYTSTRTAVEAAAPVRLFPTRMVRSSTGVSLHPYAVSPDGQRFLMTTLTEEVAAPITVILDWKAKP